MFFVILQIYFLQCGSAAAADLFRQTNNSKIKINKIKQFQDQD